jgi:monoterpene epsilon-lactone hydrolase
MGLDRHHSPSFVVRPRVGDPSLAEQTLLETFRSVDERPLSAGDLSERRDALTRVYAPRIERAIERYRPAISELNIAGIPCTAIAPRTDPREGTLLYFFGGGFVSGTARQDLPISAALAHFTGLRIISPQYRLAPEHPWPAALEDAFAVYEALAAQGSAGPLAVVGESSGGNLGLGVMLRARHGNVRLPRAVALLSPWSDLTGKGERVGGPSDPSLSDAYLSTAASLYAGAAPLIHPDISPIYGEFDEQFPPMLITTGTCDRLRVDCDRLAVKLAKAGISVSVSVWQDLWHVFEFYDEFPEAELSLREIASFLTYHLNQR